MPFLDWVNKNQAKEIPLEVPYHLLKREKTYGDAQAASENFIIQGDNLLALKSLIPFYAGQVKCIFIDPPYNTKSASISTATQPRATTSRSSWTRCSVGKTSWQLSLGKKIRAAETIQIFPAPTTMSFCLHANVTCGVTPEIC